MDSSLAEIVAQLKDELNAGSGAEAVEKHRKFSSIAGELQTALLTGKSFEALSESTRATVRELLEVSESNEGAPAVFEWDDADGTPAELGADINWQYIYPSLSGIARVVCSGGDLQFEGNRCPKCGAVQAGPPVGVNGYFECKNCSYYREGSSPI